MRFDPQPDLGNANVGSRHKSTLVHVLPLPGGRFLFPDANSQSPRKGVCIMLELFVNEEGGLTAGGYGLCIGILLVCLLFGGVLSPHLGTPVTLILALLVSGAVYWVILLLLKNFREQELEAIPGGKLINMLGQMLRVY